MICRDGDGGRGREKLINIVTFIFNILVEKKGKPGNAHKAILLQKVKKDQT